MLYPVCPTCGTLLADKQIPFEAGLQKILNDKTLTDEKKAKSRSALLDSLEIYNYCCRMRTISYVPLEKIISERIED